MNTEKRTLLARYIKRFRQNAREAGPAEQRKWTPALYKQVATRHLTADRKQAAKALRTGGSLGHGATAMLGMRNAIRAKGKARGKGLGGKICRNIRGHVVCFVPKGGGAKRKRR